MLGFTAQMRPEHHPQWTVHTVGALVAVVLTAFALRPGPDADRAAQRSEAERCGPGGNGHAPDGPA
jgi:hypothetical protein